tara:strand:+ start:1327 stop:1521 length:195 start_codon:yes stop_codon:yes gene_type:complete
MVKLVNFNDTYYQLVREIKVEQVNGNMEALKAWRDMNNCDHVLRHADKFLLVRIVKDAKIENYD